MAAAAGGGAGGGRREPPHTLQGLLEMAVVAGEAQPEPRQPMAEERQRWLREAVSQALSGPGSTRAELQRCLRLLAGPCPGEAAPERGLGDTGGHEGALEELCDLCESLDNANEFCSLGGLEVVLDLLGHRWPPLRAGAARLLGSCAQNLPAAQGRALALGALPALLGALRADPDPRVAPAALFAVSCLVRAQPEGLQQLEALGGLEVLGGALQSPHPPLRARGAFLLHCLLREHPRLKAPLVQQGLVPRVAALLRSEHDGAHEHGLGVLCSLAWGCPEGLRECRDPALGLEELLRERRELLRGRDEFQEELEFCERLLQLCFETPPEESTMDR
ncbi:hsp70-binding protein 1 isoform X4 [Ammospiza caudacuta]|uniref:hsp70-binding protein 1 isoform X1 n=1 Tax=Ammospiza caudacuta TaxID=2857398 RepID=UPI00273864D7|nr:hsp70-binding protein 1 isoform X1 [Ammospiza caudacuta]XP_058678751.1 hsp70-binding protein 1 isoform X2 [Ammospiza caudacuta]XP_058678753.1 hsp70-binding protein 1 isoform X3 [Ammospiza caudacuta]XP_058678754.1 hsp70-binding protein 1 isoform X4 [Ammospiza caudacuta]